MTADLTIEWATRSTRGSSGEVYQARRLDVARIFARHLQVLDPTTEVPPDDVLSRRYRRIPPYLYRVLLAADPDRSHLASYPPPQRRTKRSIRPGGDPE